MGDAHTILYIKSLLSKFSMRQTTCRESRVSVAQAMDARHLPAAGAFGQMAVNAQGELPAVFRIRLKCKQLLKTFSLKEVNKEFSKASCYICNNSDIASCEPDCAALT